MLCSPLLMQLEIGMSISRYLPATGTAGLERAFVSGYSRVPRPPPRIRDNTERMARCLGPRRGGDRRGEVRRICDDANTGPIAEEVSGGPFGGQSYSTGAVATPRAAGTV